MSESTTLSIAYEWQQPQWQTLVDKEAKAHLPHAILIAGPKGLGKTTLAQAFSVYLLCESVTKRDSAQACGQCKSCQLNSAGSHPDLVILEPEEAGKAIKIDQVRGLMDFVHTTAQFNGYRIVIVNPAEALNTAAANALLKSLEEPGSNTLFLLVTHSPSSLLPTIKSRCQMLSCSVPPLAASLPWLSDRVESHHRAEALLNAANGCPLVALDFSQSTWFEKRSETLSDLLEVLSPNSDPVKVAKKWLDYPTIELIDWLMIWLTDAVKIQSGCSNTISNVDLAQDLNLLSRQTSSAQLFRFVDELKTVKRHLLSASNPNKQLLLEDLLLSWRC